MITQHSDLHWINYLLLPCFSLKPFTSSAVHDELDKQIFFPRFHQTFTKKILLSRILGWNYKPCLYQLWLSHIHLGFFSIWTSLCKTIFVKLSVLFPLYDLATQVAEEVFFLIKLCIARMQIHVYSKRLVIYFAWEVMCDNWPIQ